MEIVKLEIQWWHGYANNPTFKATVDEIPNYEEAIWQAVPNPNARANTTLLSTNQRPIIRFKYIDNPNDPPNRGGALGGNHLMEDGSIFKTSCGWSSRVGVINRDYKDFLPGGEEFVEVSLRTVHTSYLAGMALPISLVKEHLPAGVFAVRETKFDNEPYWHPSVNPDSVEKPSAF